MSILNIMALTLTEIVITKQHTIILHCLTKHLEQLFPVVKEMIIDSVFPEEE